MQQLHRPFIASENIGDFLNSPFREIYLLTQSEKKGHVVVPIKANIIAGEIGLFRAVFIEHIKSASTPATFKDYLLGLSEYLRRLSPTIGYTFKDGMPCFVFANVSWTYTQKQHVEIINVSTNPVIDAKPLEPDETGTALSAELWEKLEASKKSILSTYELYWSWEKNDDKAAD